MSLEARKQEIIQDLSLIEDPHERMEYLIDRARQHPQLEEEFQTEAFRVKGCLSKLWLVPKFRDGKCYFQVHSDSLLVKGIAAVLAELYSNADPEEIIHVDPAFLEQLGIREHLSYNRKNALSSVYKIVKGYAENCLRHEGCPHADQCENEERCLARAEGYSHAHGSNSSDSNKDALSLFEQ